MFLLFSKKYMITNIIIMTRRSKYRNANLYSTKMQRIRITYLSVINKHNLWLTEKHHVMYLMEMRPADNMESLSQRSHLTV
jgi:hypothetical protein